MWSLGKEWRARAENRSPIHLVWENQTARLCNRRRRRQLLRTASPSRKHTVTVAEEETQLFYYLHFCNHLTPSNPPKTTAERMMSCLIVQSHVHMFWCLEIFCWSFFRSILLDSFYRADWDCYFPRWWTIKKGAKLQSNDIFSVFALIKCCCWSSRAAKPSQSPDYLQLSGQRWRNTLKSFSAISGTNVFSISVWNQVKSCL